MDNREARRAWRLFVTAATAAIVLIFGLAVPPVSVRAHNNPTVKVSVDAFESAGNPLRYQWRATDGHIVDQNLPTTYWTLPDGPGIHFAYVLVSNGKGGYTEGRIAVYTDDNPTKTVVPRDNHYRLADSRISNRPDPITPTQSQVIFHSPAGKFEDLLVNPGGTINGQLKLSDDSFCGKRIPFFGVEATATVELRDKNDISVPDTKTAVDPYTGQFTLKDNSLGTKLVAMCEGAALETTDFRSGPKNLVMRDTFQPEVNSMSATQNGKSVGIFPVPPALPIGMLPSDFRLGRQDDNVVERTARFLSFKGLDSRKSGCEYYKAIGAVVDCDDAGNFMGKVLNFKDWRQSVGIGEFKTAGGPNEAEAVFVNKVDLNLTRDHHSIAANGLDSQMQQQLAAYVCNHPGPASDPADPTGLFPDQPAVDTAIDNVLKVDAAHPQGRNLVACVAMDRSSNIGDVHGNPLGQSFTRFLIFGSNGDLLPSVNLDGNGEKFVPGACVACHGGNKYFALANDTPNAPAASLPIYGGFGGFAETASATTPRDLQSYFLPYDVGNFGFSSKQKTGNSPDNTVQEAIFQLNDNAFRVDQEIAAKAGAPSSAAAFADLFHRWYTPGTMIFKEAAAPPALVPGQPEAYPTTADKIFYSEVVAYSCRTCHVAMDAANWETTPAFSGGLVCATDITAEMPNAQVTFDRFWLSNRPKDSHFPQPCKLDGFPK